MQKPATRTVPVVDPWLNPWLKPARRTVPVVETGHKNRPRGFPVAFPWLSLGLMIMYRCRIRSAGCLDRLFFSAARQKSGLPHL